MNSQRILASNWFTALRDDICNVFEALEQSYAENRSIEIKKFKRKLWQRDGGGGGEMSIMHGHVFEKVGVNISTVFGEFSPEFRRQIPGTDEKGSFYATGISIVAHMNSPLIPSAHLNTRYLETTKHWFGGGSDLTPTFEEQLETENFHQNLERICSNHNPDYYPKFKKECDQYFYLKHRNEARGIGGIFYDYLNSNNFSNDLNFTKDVGLGFKENFVATVEKKMYLPWTEEQKEAQLIKRSRYVEFNLLYDRGIKFGLMTGGNIEAMFMSLPPNVKWL